MVTLQVLLPWLRGWEERCEIITFENDVLKKPLTKGYPPTIIYKFEPVEPGKDFVAWIYGFFTMVTSPYIHVSVFSHARRRIIICLAPYYATEFGLTHWQSFAIYVTRSDEYVTVCNFVPDDPLPISSIVDKVVELQAFLPKTYKDFVNRVEKEVPHNEAYINYIGISYYYVYDTEAFLDSWKELMKKVFGGNFELLELTLKELAILPKLLQELSPREKAKIMKAVTR